MRSGTFATRLLPAAGCLMATLWAAPADAQLNGENLLGDMGVKSGTPARARRLRLQHLLPLRHGLHQGHERQEPVARSERCRATDDQRGHAGDPLRLVEESPRRAFRDDGRAAGGERRARSARLRLHRESEHRPQRHVCHAGAARVALRRAPTRLSASASSHRPAATPPAPATTSARACGATKCRPALPSTSIAQRSLSLSSTAFWEAHGKKKAQVHVEQRHVVRRQGRAAPHARGRRRQVVPARRGDIRRRLLRAVESHRRRVRRHRGRHARGLPSATSTACSASDRTSRFRLRRRRS